MSLPANLNRVQESTYLIVGGTTKAGTTSLYKYLADHPQICASTLKETRFFLDLNYPLPSPARFEGDNIGRYTEFFGHCAGEKIRMEATPDYLYSEQALNVAKLLPHAKIIFILRDPIERLVSWYKFAKQRGMLDETVSFDAYVHMQLNVRITPSTPVHLRTLEQGRYDQYLVRFRQAMGNRVMEIGFDELRDRPIGTMKKLSVFAGIDGRFYEDYQFSIKNKSVAVRSQIVERTYSFVRTRLAYLFHKGGLIKRCLQIPNRMLQRLMALNRREPIGVDVSPKMKHILDEYYEKNDV